MNGWGGGAEKARKLYGEGKIRGKVVSIWIFSSQVWSYPNYDITLKPFFLYKGSISLINKVYTLSSIVIQKFVLSFKAQKNIFIFMEQVNTIFI